MCCQALLCVDCPRGSSLRWRAFTALTDTSRQTRFVYNSSLAYHRTASMYRKRQECETALRKVTEACPSLLPRVVRQCAWLLCRVGQVDHQLQPPGTAK